MARERESIRKPKKKGRFLLGLAMGVAAGVGGGTTLLKRAGGEEPLPEFGRPDEPYVLTPSEARPGGTAPVQTAPGPKPNPANQFIENIKQRWQEALAAGKETASEREAELQAQYEREISRPAAPALDPAGRTAGELQRAQIAETIKDQEK